MKATEINQHLNSLFPGVRDKTVDRVICGDPKAEVTGVAVAWMPYRETIARAKAAGANVMVVHEPTFFEHWDLDAKELLPEAYEKKAWIEEQGMTIIRCHDVWDALPDIGIPYAWGDYLELGEPVGGERYYNVYEVPEQSARDFTRRMAAYTAKLGQETLEFYGDGGRAIRKVGLGTGCISNPFKIYELGADLAISVDDVVRAWVAGEWCRDNGRPLVVVNHCVTEEPGMVTLAEHLRKTFPDVKVTHLAQACTYESVRA